MKNYLLGAGTVLALALLSFSTVGEILTIKPALPKNVMTTTVHYDNVNPIIRAYTKQGYIVKSITTLGGSYAINIVMEKY